MLLCDHPPLQEVGVALFLHLRVLGLGLIAEQARAGLTDPRLISLEHGARLLDLSPVPGEVGLGLGERGLVDAGVDREEQVALLDVLPFLDVDAEQLAADLRLDRHHRGGLDGADGLDLERDRLLLDGRDADRHRGAPGGRRRLDLVAGATREGGHKEQDGQQ